MTRYVLTFASSTSSALAEFQQAHGGAPPHHLTESTMPNSIRAKFDGGDYFFAVVTVARAPISTTPLARRILRQSWKDVQSRYAGAAQRASSQSVICQWAGSEGMRTKSRSRKGKAAVSQRRFWEHLIGDEADVCIGTGRWEGPVSEPGNVPMLMAWA